MSSAGSEGASSILVVDDDADIGFWIEQTLSRAGYVVTVVKSVAEARPLLKSADYGLILADWKLPDGSGVLLAREAKAAGVRTLVMTGYALSLPPAAFEGHDCLRKPMSADDLLDAVQHRIRTDPPEDPGRLRI